MLFHSEALQSYGMTFQGVKSSRFGSGRCNPCTDRYRWGNSSHKVAQALHSNEGPEFVNQEDKQIAPSFHAYCKGTPQTDCAVVRVFFHLERVDLPLVLGHTQCSGTSVGVPC